LISKYTVLQAVAFDDKEDAKSLETSTNGLYVDAQGDYSNAVSAMTTATTGLTALETAA